MAMLPAPTTISRTDRQMEYYLKQARRAGCPEDQVRNFLRGGYVGQVKQLLFHAAARRADLDGAPDKIALGGARGPGKSHACLAQVGLDDCQRVAGLKWLFLRSIKRSAMESFEDLVQRVYYAIPYSLKAAGRLDFPNGSRILLGGFHDEDDIDQYIGIEYDGIVIEEATLLSKEKRDKLLGSLRTSREDWRPRLYLSSNPGGIGHQWFRNDFVLPYRAGAETRTKFIPSNYLDNRFLNKEYREYLEGLTGPLGAAWRDGDWDSFEGMAFPTWSDFEHVIDPFDIPEGWPRWRAVDWGYAAPFCCLWFAKDVRRGRVYVYRELYSAHLTDEEQAKSIVELTTPGEQVHITYADPALWEDQSHLGVGTTADIYKKNGVVLTRADNARLSGKRKVDRLLGDMIDGKPGIQVFRTCKNLVRTMPILPRDEHRVEDVDTKAEDHAFDTLKYGLTNIKIDLEPPKENKLKPMPMAGIPNL